MKKKNLIVFGLCVLQFFGSANGSVPSAILANMGASLKISDPALLSLIMTLPSLTMIPTNLLSGFLGQKYSKKALFMVGATIFLFAGLAPIFTTSFTLILVFRAIFGLGVGFIFPLGFGMIHDYLEGDAAHSATGIVNAAGLIFSIPISIMSGILAAGGWQTSFWIYAFALVAIVIVMAFVPKKERKTPTADGAPKEKSGAPHYSTYIYTILTIMFYAGAMVSFTTLSTYVVSSNMGDAAIVGTAGAMSSVGGFIISLFFGKIYKGLGKYTGFITILLDVVAFVILFAVPSIVAAFIAMLLVGASLGTVTPVMITSVVRRSPKTASLSPSIVLAGLCLGQFLTTYVIKIFMAIGNGSYTFMYLCVAIFLAVTAVLLLITDLSAKSVPVASHEGH